MLSQFQEAGLLRFRSDAVPLRLERWMLDRDVSQRRSQRFTIPLTELNRDILEPNETKSSTLTISFDEIDATKLQAAQNARHQPRRVYLT